MITILYYNKNLTSFFFPFAVGQACVGKKFNFDSVVCVCNATYCDTLTGVRAPLAGNYVHYTSTKDGSRFVRTVGSFSSKTASQGMSNCISYRYVQRLNAYQKYAGVQYRVDTRNKYQRIIGFGAAFTDSAGINILSLSKPTQEFLLKYEPNFCCILELRMGKKIVIFIRILNQVLFFARRYRIQLRESANRRK